MRKEIWTTIIQGDLDEEGKVYQAIVNKFKKEFDEVNAVYRHYNRKNIDYGTHARLLIVAAMMTSGDILELGTGYHSTELLHEILEEDNKKNNKRSLISADSDPKWIVRYKDLSSYFHQPSPIIRIW